MPTWRSPTRFWRKGPATVPQDTCLAASTALRLNPRGIVTVCCVNEEVPLGSITNSSLRELWDGPVAEQLRVALAQGDYSLGCDACGTLANQGLRSASLARDFDWLEPSPGLRWPRHIEFALSNTCNLRCVQCSGELSSAIRARRELRPPLPPVYDDAFFDELPDFLPNLISASFIGGEPFLARETQRVWDLLIESDIRPDVWVTTNGTIWNDRVLRYLTELRMGISLSIDGVDPDTIAAIRVGADPDALLANRDRFIATTRSYGGSVKLNYCVMRQNWREFMPFLLDADTRDLDVYAARVHQPAEHSLFHLPAEELDDVVATMSSDRRADQLVRNRAVWDDVLRQLAAARGQPTPVAVRQPTRRT